MSPLSAVARQEYHVGLGNSLPPPLVNAVEAFEALCPGDAYEARLAVQIVLSGAHTAENLREARVFRADSAKRSRCRAQAAGMMREERAASRMLAREQKLRLATEAVASTPKPQPAAASAPPPPSPEAIAKAEVFVQQHVVAAAQIRHDRGVTPQSKAYVRHLSLPTDPAVIDALVRGTSDAPTLLGKAAGRDQNENMGYRPVNRYFETAVRRFRRSLPGRHRTSRQPLESTATGRLLPSEPGHPAPQPTPQPYPIPICRSTRPTLAGGAGRTDSSHDELDGGGDDPGGVVVTPPPQPSPANAGERFILAHTLPGHAPLVPEITLHLASEITPIWQATESWLAAHDVPPPFWAFAWPGGQALARHVLDHPATVAHRRVLDFAAGGGIAAIACALAGAASVEAAEIDPLAAAAIRLNAAANRVPVTPLAGDIVGTPCRWDLILCGDVCYEAPMTAHILPWLAAMARGARVWLADPGRAYLPRDGLAPFATYTVPTSLELEDRTERTVSLYRFLGGPD